MSEIELYASCSSLGHVRIQLAVLRQEGIAIGQTVSHNVAGTHLLQEELTVAARGKLPLGRHWSEVCQYRQPGLAARFDNGVYRRPGEARLAKCPSIVAGLESDDKIGVFPGGIHCKLHFKLCRILFRSV